MPTYSYHCTACDSSFDLFKKVSERDEPVDEPCPDCGFEGSVTKQLTAATLVYSPGTTLRTTDQFNSRLQHIKENTGKIGNTIDVRRSPV